MGHGIGVRGRWEARGKGCQVKQVKERGGEPMGPPYDLTTGPYGVRAFMFPDPDGFLVEFCQFTRR